MGAMAGQAVPRQGTVASMKGSMAQGMVTREAMVGGQKVPKAAPGDTEEAATMAQNMDR